MSYPHFPYSFPQLVFDKQTIRIVMYDKERGTHMKSNVLDVVENTSIVLGVTISLQTIYSILGIILLVFQIGLIVYKVIKSIVKHTKNKEFDKIEDDIEQGISEIHNVVDKDGK